MNRITPSDVGQRVTLLFEETDGTRTEAIGVFESISKAGDSVTLEILRKDGTTIRVPLSAIRHGKVVAPPQPSS